MEASKGKHNKYTCRFSSQARIGLDSSSTFSLSASCFLNPSLKTSHVGNLSSLCSLFSFSSRIPSSSKLLPPLLRPLFSFFSSFSRSLCFSLSLSNFSFQFFFLSPFFSFSLGAKPLETPRIFPHAFSSHSTESFYPDFSKTPSFFSSKCLIFSSFFQTSILRIRTTPFSFIFSSGIPHLQP